MIANPFLTAASAAILVFCTTIAEAEVVSNLTEPFVGETFVSCANGGAGEFVDFAGIRHVLVTEQEDGSGKLHGVVHLNFINTSGTGRTTGDVYRAASGVQRDVFNFESLSGPLTFTRVLNLLIIGKSQSVNFRVQVTYHLTIDSAGETTIEIFNLRENCS